MSNRLELIKSKIKNVEDFPKPGILFKDITPVLADPLAYKYLIELLVEKIQNNPLFTSASKIACIESRGFVLGAPLAYATGKGLILVRKPKKLPRKVFTQSYDLEYGQDTLEMHTDALNPNEKVLLLDDVIATGGTAWAAAQLINQAQANLVGGLFLIDLTFLKGTERLKPVICDSLIAI